MDKSKCYFNQSIEGMNTGKQMQDQKGFNQEVQKIKTVE